MDVVWAQKSRDCGKTRTLAHAESADAIMARLCKNLKFQLLLLMFNCLPRILLCLQRKVLALELDAEIKGKGLAQHVFLGRIKELLLTFRCSTNALIEY